MSTTYVGSVIKVTASRKLKLAATVANKYFLSTKNSKSVSGSRSHAVFKTVPIPLSTQVFEYLLLHKI